MGDGCLPLLLIVVLLGALFWLAATLGGDYERTVGFREGYCAALDGLYIKQGVFRNDTLTYCIVGDSIIPATEMMR